MKCEVCKKELQTASAQRDKNGKWVTTYQPWSKEEIEVLLGMCNECTHEHVNPRQQVLPDIYPVSELYRVMYAQDRQNIVLTRIKENVLGLSDITPHLSAIETLDSLKKQAYLERWDSFGAIYLIEMARTDNNIRDVAVMNRFGSANPNRFMWLARLVNGTPKKTGLHKGLSTVYWQRTVALAAHGTPSSAIGWLNGVDRYQVESLEGRT